MAIIGAACVGFVGEAAALAMSANQDGERWTVSGKQWTANGGQWTVGVRSTVSKSRPGALESGAWRCGGFRSGGAGDEEPEEPCGDGPEEEGRGDFDETDFDVGGEDEEGKSREDLARACCVGAAEQRGNGEALVVEPEVGCGEKRHEDEGAGVGEPVPMSAAAPEVGEGPEAGEGDRKVLQPDCVRTDPMAQGSGEAGNELVFDGGRVHEARVIGPGRGVDEGGKRAGEGESDDESGEELPGAGENDPDGKHGSERQQQMGLEGAKPERGSGVEGVGAVEAEKKDQAEEREERGLAHGEADDGRGEGEAEPVDSIWGRAVELMEDADGDEQAGEEQEGPEDSGEAQAKEAEGVGDRKSPRRVAHDENGVRVKAGGVLDGPDGVAVVGIVVVNELEAGSPVRKEVATGSQFASNGESKDVEDGDGEGQAGGSGDRDLSEVAAAMCWRKIQLAGHGGYSTAAAEAEDED